MSRILSVAVCIAIILSYVVSAPLSDDRCQFEAAQLYTEAIVSQEIEDADRVPLTLNATRYETYPVINVRTLRERGSDNIRQSIAYGSQTYTYDGLVPGSPDPSYVRQADGAVRSTFSLQGRITTMKPPHSGQAVGLDYGTVKSFVDLYYGQTKEPCLITDIEIHSELL